MHLPDHHGQIGLRGFLSLHKSIRSIVEHFLLLGSSPPVREQHGDTAFA